MPEISGREFKDKTMFMEDYGNGPNIPVMFMLDEFPQLGYMRAIEDAFDLGRSAKIRMWLFAQNMGQIEKQYKNASGIISACNYQSFMNVNDHKTASYISNRFGKSNGGGGILSDNSPKEIVSVAEIQSSRYKENFITLRRNDAPLTITKLYAYEDEYLVRCMNITSTLDIEEWWDGSNSTY